MGADINVKPDGPLRTTTAWSVDILRDSFVASGDVALLRSAIRCRYAAAAS